MPESFFVLTKEQLELATDEIVAIAKMYDRFSKIKTISNLVIVQSRTDWGKIAKRATFVKTSGQIIRKMSGLFLSEEKSKVLKNADTFVCRVINLSSNQFNVQELERSMGDMISKFSKARVKLENPDIIVYLIFTDKENFFGFSKSQDKGRPKKVRNHPNELDWKLARVMLNLIGLREGQTVCDPFCGTGTTLLEAEFMKIRGIGIDFNKEMYEISKGNIRANDYKSKIIQDDFHKLTEIADEFQGIVTDLPYGRNSKTTKDPKNMLKELLSIMPKKKRFAIMFKKELGEGLKLEGFKKYEIYRHKSLTRTVLIK